MLSFPVDVAGSYPQFDAVTEDKKRKEGRTFKFQNYKK